ncbi:MAG: FAD synthetase family protein [Rikenellaceae bacterium]
MQLIRGIESLPCLGATTLTVGSFDGVHSGHRSLLKLLTERARAEGRASVVVSFSPHPRITLGRADGLKLLSSDEEKAILLEEVGVDILLLIEFDAALSALSYEEFIEKYLIEKVGMAELIVGFNHHMGRNGGGIEDIVACSTKNNFRVTIAHEYNIEQDKVSSTVIRHLLESGEITQANKLLSAPYLIVGQSCTNGEMHFDEPLKLIPAAGLYRAEVDGTIKDITIDTEQRVWCQTQNKTVIIKLIERYEK